MKRHDNMRRGPVSFTLTPAAFQRTDGPIKGPAPFPVRPDIVILTHEMPTSAQMRERVKADAEAGRPLGASHNRIGADEITLHERDEPYGEPY